MDRFISIDLADLFSGAKDSGWRRYYPQNLRDICSAQDLRDIRVLVTEAGGTCAALELTTGIFNWNSNPLDDMLITLFNTSLTPVEGGWGRLISTVAAAFPIGSRKAMELNHLPPGLALKTRSVPASNSFGDFHVQVGILPGRWGPYTPGRSRGSAGSGQGNDRAVRADTGFSIGRPQFKRRNDIPDLCVLPEVQRRRQEITVGMGEGESLGATAEGGRKVTS